MGNVRVKFNNDKTILIKDVWYAPGMNNNLVNLGHLIEKGFLVTMKDNLLKLYNCNQKLIIDSKLRRNITLKVNVTTTDTQSLSARSTEGESELWHKRLEHLNYKSLWNMSSKNLVHVIPKIVVLEKSCDICMRGKQPRSSLSSEIMIFWKNASYVLTYESHVSTLSKHVSTCIGHALTHKRKFSSLCRPETLRQSAHQT